MAEIRDELVLEIDQALRQINQIEGALDRALAPIEIEVDTANVEQLEGTLREIERIAERASTETSAMALAAGKAEVNFEDVARALNISEDEARKLTEEILEAQAAANRLEDASRDVARQLGLSDTEANRLVRSLNAADRAAESIDVAAIGLAGRFAALRTSAGGIAGVLAGLGGAAIFGGAIIGANAAIQSFARLEDSVNAVNVVFKEGAGIVLEFGETAAQSAGLSQEAFNNAVAPIGALLTNFGFNATEAADAAVVLIQRGADLASVYGGTVQDALLAINSALVGQVEPLRRFGGEISQARVEAFALATGLLAAGQEMDTATAVQARFGLILKDTAVVAGDFVNTADDLANAQRTAGAEAQNLVAVFGEALAPALEAILIQAPQVLNFFESLTPALAASADEATASAAGITKFVSGLTLGLGQAGDTFGGLVDVLQLVPAAFQGLAAGAEKGDQSFEALNAQLDQFQQRITNSVVRVASQSIPAAMAKGMSAVNAFGQAIAFIGQQDDVNALAEGFERLRIQSGLTDAEAQAVTVSLIAQAEVLTFTAEEVAFLNDQLDIFNNNLTVVGNEVNQAAASMAGFNEPFSTATTTFTTFAGATETAQERASNALIQLAEDAEAQAIRTAAAFDLFAELPEKITGSFTAAVDALREQVEAAFDFDVNLAILRALNLDALADEFADQGIAAAGQLAQAVNDIPEAIEADRLLQGFSDLGTDAFNALVKQFIDAGLTPADAQRLARTLSSPEVIAAAEEAGRSVGAAQAESYHSRLTEDLDQLIPEIGESIGRSVETHWVLEEQADTAARDTAQSYVDGIIGFNIDDRIQEIFESVSFVVNLFDVGADSASSYVAGFQEELASRQDAVTSAITGTLDTAIQRDSPPKLFLDAGKESGAAFWSGFEEAGLGPLRTPETGVTGTMVNPTAAANTGNGINVNLTTINPTQQDEVSDVARMGQIASSIAASYRSVVPNGM